MRPIFILCTTLLAGCSTPSDLVKENQRFDYRSAKPVAAVAACVKRNADELGSGAGGQTFTTIDGDLEVVVRQANGGPIMAVAQIVTDRGTRVSALITQSGSSAGRIANALVNDCL